MSKINVRKLVEHKLLKEEWYQNKRLDELFDQLVPVQGIAGTNAGEIVRAVSRIIYRWYNDGDKFFEGYGIETCGPSVLWLREQASGKIRDVAKESTEGMSDTEYESWLADLGDAAVETIDNAPEGEKEWLQKVPEEDSRIYKENDLPWEEEEDEEDSWYYNNDSNYNNESGEW